MEIYYDTEFLDTGSSVFLLSIGMVAQDDRTYYAIVNDMYLIKRAAMVPWLRENVLAHFPLAQPIDPKSPWWDESHPDFFNVKSRVTIAREVQQFVYDTANPSLWAWFAAYDHLMLSQLYGKMIDMPPGIPQRTNDIAQEAERLGSNVRVPHMPGLEAHNALSDAKEVKFRREWLLNYANVQNTGQG